MIETIKHLTNVNISRNESEEMTELTLNEIEIEVHDCGDIFYFVNDFHKKVRVEIEIDSLMQLVKVLETLKKLEVK